MERQCVIPNPKSRLIQEMEELKDRHPTEGRDQENANVRNADFAKYYRGLQTLDGGVPGLQPVGNPDSMEGTSRPNERGVTIDQSGYDVR